MNRSKGKFILLLLIFSASLLKGQQTLSILEDSMKVIAPKILHASTEAERLKASDNLKSLLSAALKEAGSFDYQFDSLRTLSRMYSEDRYFRILNWNVRLDDGRFKYHCLVQTKTKTIDLIDKTEEIRNPEAAGLTPSKWYGAHYYEIVKVKRRKKTYYTLLGWKGNDRLTTKKVIEVFRFSAKDELQLGDNVFDMAGKSPKRVIFEYAAEVSMSLKYDPQQKRIIFDHLSPRSSDLAGQFQFYSPDLSYDAFRLKKGKWKFEEDIDARNPGNIRDKQFKEPK